MSGEGRASDDCREALPDAVPLPRSTPPELRAVVRTTDAWRRALEARNEAIYAASDAGFSNREIGRMSGLSHEAVRLILQSRR